MAAKKATRVQELSILADIAGDELVKSARNMFDADLALQDEFGGQFETYLAFYRADLSGLIKETITAKGLSKHNSEA